MDPSPEPSPSPGPPPPNDPDEIPESGSGDEGPLQGGELPDCSMIDISCHVTNWFADFVTGALNPALGWIAGIAFGIPPVPDGVAGLWSGTQTVTNLLFVLLVLAAGGVVMGRSALTGAQHQAGEVLGRLAFAFIASNASLWLSRELFTAANGVSRGVAAMSVDPEVSVERLRERMDSVLMEGVVFFVLLLV